MIQTIDPLSVDWPPPWLAVIDETIELAVFPRVTATITEELSREMAPSHPLYGIECVPLAIHGGNRKDVLFATSHPRIPFAVIHFTGVVETTPHWPFVTRYRTLNDFLKKRASR
jgi:hypothetical protein